MMNDKESTGKLFREGISLAKTGNRDAARTCIRQVVERDAENEAAWLYLAAIAADADEASHALDTVKSLNPANPHLEKAQVWFDKTWVKKAEVNPEPLPAPPATVPTTPRKKLPMTVARVAVIGALVILGLTIAGLVVSSSVTANFVSSIVATPTNTVSQILASLRQEYLQAQTDSDQPAMIASLEAMLALAPDDEATAIELAGIYFDQGMILRNGGNFVEAQIAFSNALATQPDFEAAQNELSLAELYQTGVKYHQEANWIDAVEAFEAIYARSPAYPYIDEILYSSYFNLGLLQAHRQDLKPALESYQKAADILPGAPEAPKKVAEVSLLLNPPTPTPTPTPQPTATTPPPPIPTATPVPVVPQTYKSIVVDISEQRAYVYEGNELIYLFIISTGEPGRDTAVGNFQILNKIPMAYASTWNLDMPYWMGIYWSGSLQNGFHALPTVRHTGYTLWDGYLGQRVSYGCIILSQADAETLYNWADIGTPVTVQW